MSERIERSVRSDVSHRPWPWSLRPKSNSLALGPKSLALTVVLGLGVGRRLEKILTHYIYTINSLLFDSDNKRADICSQMEFMPLGYLFERILAVPASPAPVAVKTVISTRTQKHAQNMNIKNDVKRPGKNMTLTSRVLGLGTQVLGLEPQVLLNITKRTVR